MYNTFQNKQLFKKKKPFSCWKGLDTMAKQGQQASSTPNAVPKFCFINPQYHCSLQDCSLCLPPEGYNCRPRATTPCHWGNFWDLKSNSQHLQLSLAKAGTWSSSQSINFRTISNHEFIISDPFLFLRLYCKWGHCKINVLQVKMRWPRPPQHILPSRHRKQSGGCAFSIQSTVSPGGGSLLYYFQVKKP